jgi:hypothetical protein
MRLRNCSCRWHGHLVHEQQPLLSGGGQKRGFGFTLGNRNDQANRTFALVKCRDWDYELTDAENGGLRTSGPALSSVIMNIGPPRVLGQAKLAAVSCFDKRPVL